jgi:hypothetical protein
MKNRGKSRTWLWLLLAVILAGFIAYIITSRYSGKPEKPLITEKLTSLEKKVPSEEPQDTNREREETLSGPNNEEPPLKSLSEEDYCAKIKKNMADFFHYLDQTEYFQHLNPKMDAYARFRGILKRSTDWPPIPAGEGIDPSIMIRNVYHLSRVLNKQDIHLIREVIRNENGAMEINLDMLYKWLNLDDNCPDPGGLRPTMEVLYQYAGFFLNTIGGRAYLFRRSPDLRLLTSYYCLMIVHEADKRGKNNYGIDILPFIAPLREEIIHYPDFQFGSEYINTLNNIEDYYLRKR